MLFGRGFQERPWLLAWERLGVSSYWLVSMERVDAIEEMVFCSVHLVSLIPSRWLNHSPTCCDALLPLDDRISRQSAT